jgi:hypothetical protein
MQHSRGVLQPVLSVLPSEHLLLGQRLHDFLHEKGIAPGLRQNQLFERLSFSPVSE